RDTCCWSVSVSGDKGWVWQDDKRGRALENFHTSDSGNPHFSKSGRRFVCEGADQNSAMVWRTDTGDSQRLNVLRHTSATCEFLSHFSSDERYIVASWGGESEIFVYRRQHPEGLAGILAVPEFWIGSLSAIGIVWQMVQLLRSKFRASRSAS